MTTSNLTNCLLSKLDGSLERVGFVLKSGEVIEVENKCDNPEEGFDVSGTDIIRYSGDAVATWHTHPNVTANLSMNDYETFLNWSELDHYIIGTDGVVKYIVVEGELIVAS